MRLVSLALVSTILFAQTDPHSPEGVARAFRTPFTAASLTAAQSFDDQILQTGEANGQRVSLVTDYRASKVGEIARKILFVAGQDPSAWVVRVLDTNPLVTNAFVAGGRYIYVYTGLLQEAGSDDEIAFILGHEVAHSLLKHHERKEESPTQTLANLALIGGLLAKHNETWNQMGQGMSNSITKLGEEEADAFGTLIAERAKYDALRGVDFFVRAIQSQAKSIAQLQAEEQAARNAYQAALANHARLVQTYNSNRSYQTPSNYQTVQRSAQDLEQRRRQGMAMLKTLQDAQTDQVRNWYKQTHPNNQSRVARVAATVDLIHGKRSLDSLASYEQTWNTLRGLQLAGVKY